MAVAWNVPPQTLPALRRVGTAPVGGAILRPIAARAGRLSPGLGLEAPQDALDPAQHLRGGPPGEREKQDAAGVGAAGYPVGDPVSEGGRLACAGSGDDEQRVVSVLDRQPLLLVQLGQDVLDGER